MGTSWHIPILTYHGLHAPGWEYQENDHVALEQDLDLLDSLGFRVVPLSVLVSHAFDKSISDLEDGKFVALSFDDGTDLDYEDFSHPDYGYLKSFRRILREKTGLGWDGTAPVGTSFVIASPEAREELDRTCIAGRGQWRDCWWADAAREGTLEIANHSWDHTHPSLKEIAVEGHHKGRFDLLEDFHSADQEILRAEKFIRRKTSERSKPMFAYPYGQLNDFLAEEYFPAREDWFKAAFTTAGEPLTAECSRWRIPRLVCGDHWRSPEELRSILAD